MQTGELRRPGEFMPAPESTRPDDNDFPTKPLHAATLSQGVDLPVIGTFGDYEILGRLALGGMAEILLARRPNHDEPVVLKKILAHYALDDDFAEMFTDEARIGMVLDHPNICRFLDWGDVDDRLYIAMEWVNGVTLGRTIRRGRKHQGIPTAMTCEIIASVADALHYAHTARNENDEIMGLVHRDVSPHNIMLGYDGSVKLLDFGIAKAQVQSHRTQAGVVKGKFAYMAPEQCLGRPLDFRIDIFALGVVLYEALTGESLYRRGSEAETMRAIVEGPLPQLADKMEGAPRELEAIIQKALAKHPKERFPTAAAMRDVLRAYVKRSGQAVGQDRVAAMVQHFFAKDLKRGPMVDSTPFGSSYNVGEPEPRPTLKPKKPKPDVQSTRRPTSKPAKPMPSGARDIDLGPAPGDLLLPETDLGAKPAPAPSPSAADDGGFDIAMALDEALAETGADALVAEHARMSESVSESVAGAMSDSMDLPLPEFDAAEPTRAPVRPVRAAPAPAPAPSAMSRMSTPRASMRASLPPSASGPRPVARPSGSSGRMPAATPPPSSKVWMGVVFLLALALTGLVAFGIAGGYFD